MLTLRRLGIVVAVLLILMAASASAEVRLGTISVGAGYGYSSGPYWGPYWGYYPGPFYGPWAGYAWYGYPLYSPVYYAAQPNVGQVSLKTSHKNAAVYLDGAYAGTAAKLKNFWLAPGVYELELRAAGQTPQTRRIYVLSGRTLKLSME